MRSKLDSYVLEWLFWYWLSNSRFPDIGRQMILALPTSFDKVFYVLINA